MIVVDRLQNWGWHHGPSSHLISTLPGHEGTRELLAFAVKIDLQEKWLQKRGTHHEHFDLNVERHDRALAEGATEVDRNQLVRYLRAKR